MNISEKEIEDVVCQRIDEVVGDRHGRTTVLARQLTLPSGRRLDVLAITFGVEGADTLTVVEVKAGVATADALYQLIDYMESVALGLSADVRDRVQVRGVVCAPAVVGDWKRVVPWMPAVALTQVETYMMFHGPYEEMDWRGEPWMIHAPDGSPQVMGVLPESTLAVAGSA